MSASCSGKMPTPVVPTEQHDAVTVATVAIGECPFAARIEMDERVDPSAAIEIRPLIAWPQMGFDNRATDGFEVDQPGIVAKVGRDPAPERRFQRRLGIGVDRPIVERSPPGRPVTPPPLRLAVHAATSEPACAPVRAASTTCPAVSCR